MLYDARWSDAVILSALLATAVEPPMSFVTGEEPAILLSGQRPGTTVRLSVSGPYEKWSEGKDGQWRPSKAMYRSWADFTVRGDGTVDSGAQAPVAGTYVGRDSYGLFWSMRRPGDATLAGLAPLGEEVSSGKVLTVEAGGRTVSRRAVTFRDPPDLTVETVEQGALNGVYAAPKSGGRRPAIILLHGSEGGSMASARALAVRFAGQGQAAFAFNYFAYDIAKLKGVPNIHVNVPIEGLQAVRDWMAQRPEVDAQRIAVYGHSKGAEFATVAAVRYPWIRKVIACVPSDVVWEGYGIGDQRSTMPKGFVAPAKLSSWSWRGEPLPYVPLQPWSNTPDRGYFDNTGRYENGRRDHPADAAAAAIPIERSNARFLLIGSMRDETWASGAMAKRLAARLRASGKGARVTLKVYETAGHQVCGDGTYSSFVWGDASADPRVKDPAAEGAAAADAWRTMKKFLRHR